MDFIRITCQDTNRWRQLWELYEQSFPPIERRILDDHLRAMEDKKFIPLSVWNQGQLLGLLFYWEYDSSIYLEHLAVSPSMRSGGYGAKILHWLKQKGKTIILEIEPLSGVESHRRLKFYKREKFLLTPYTFLQLPYRRDFSRIELLLVSYPASISESEYFAFCNFINTRVGLYCQR